MDILGVWGCPQRGPGGRWSLVWERRPTEAENFSFISLSVMFMSTLPVIGCYAVHCATGAGRGYSRCVVFMFTLTM